MIRALRVMQEKIIAEREGMHGETVFSRERKQKNDGFDMSAFKRRVLAARNIASKKMAAKEREREFLLYRGDARENRG